MDALKDVAKFITSLKRRQGRKLAADRNGQMLAKRQLSAIKKWAGTNLGAGFAGRDHDAAVPDFGLPILDPSVFLQPQSWNGTKPIIWSQSISVAFRVES